MNPRPSRFIPSTGKLLAAVPAIVCASQAKASVIYTDLGTGVSAPNIYFNLDGSGVYTSPGPSFQFELNTAKSSLFVDGSNSLDTAAGDLSSHAIYFSAGDVIDGSSQFASFVTASPSALPFYLGLSVYDTDHYNYGWAEVNYSGGIGVTLLAFAYDNSGAPIQAGQTTAVPEPGSTAALAGLVAGSAAAFFALRKRNAAAA